MLHFSILLLLILLAVPAMAQPVIGNIKQMEEKDKVVQWGSKFMGDKDKYPNNNFAPSQDNQPPPSYYRPTPRSKNDPGLDAWGEFMLGPTSEFMATFGYNTTLGELFF
jgi:hypothetical protein